VKLGGSLRRRRSGVKWLDRRKKPASGLKGYLVHQFGNPKLLWGAGLVALLGFGGGYVVSTQMLFPAPPPPGDVILVPDLSGQDLAGGSETLAQAGLFLGHIDSLRHPSIPEGMIVGQSPLPGQLSPVGDTLRVAISLGPEERPVPDVMRLRADRARTVLEATGFQVVMDSVESETPRGSVVSMVPEAGTETTVPQEIRLSVSIGPPMVEMPLLLGLEEEQAVAVLDSLGLSVSEVETRFRFGRDQGLVVEQEPPAATMVERGAAVRLVVGRRGQ
jgi:serine/threonine-protein kinase